MPERRRANRLVARVFAGQVVATLVLVLSVWLVAAKVASDIHASETRARAAQIRRDTAARAAQTAQLQAGCARGVARDFESLGTNRDLRDLAYDAARARMASGDVAIARRYRMRASSAEFRMRRVMLRLPAREDDATVTAYCRALFPDPTSG